MRRIAGLDGLRALAVSGVLLYHGGFAAMPGGFLGVDLFFVISGFLITSLLLTEAAGRDGTVDVVAFWGRRVRRLLPALTLVTVSTLLLVALVPSVGDPTDVRGDALAALLYVANWHFLGSGEGYFEQLAAPSPLQHTWSLAIEEQFYVLWPLLLLLAIRRRVSQRAMAAGVAAAAVASAGWMVLLAVTGSGSDRLYYGTDTRAQSILAGVATAYLVFRPDPSTAAERHRHARRRRPVGGAVAAGALCVVLAAMLLVGEDDTRLYRGGITLYAVAAAVLVGAVVRSPRSMLTRALELRPIRYVGALSYGLYLWHWPVFLLLTAARTTLSGDSLLALRLAVTSALAVVSLHVVETPLRRSAWRLPRAVALPTGATAMACGLLLVVPAALPSSAVGGPDASSTARVRAAAASEPRSADRRSPESRSSDSRSETPTRPDPARPSPTAAAGRGEPRTLRVTVLGDSTARTLAEGLTDLPDGGGVAFRNAAALGCGIAAGSPYRYMGELDPYPRRRCSAWETRWRRAVAAHPVDVVAVLVGRWEVVDQVIDGTWTHVGRPRFDRYLRRELEKAVAAATATGADVVFLTAPYCSRGVQLDGGTWPEDDPARVDAFNRLVRSVAAAHPGTAHVVELGRRTSGGAHEYVAEVDGVDLRYDGVHFTAEAARWLEPWLASQLRRTTRAT